MRTRTPATAVPAPSERPELEPDVSALTETVDSDESNDAGAERRSRRSFVFFGALAAATMLPKTGRAQGVKSRQRRPAEPATTDRFPMVKTSDNVAAFSEWAGSVEPVGSTHDDGRHAGRDDARDADGLSGLSELSAQLHAHQR